MAIERLYELFTNWLNQRATPQEEEELATLLADPEQEGAIKELLERYWEELPSPFSLDGAAADEIFSQALAARPGAAPQPETPVRRLPVYRRWLAAASVILLLGIGAWLWWQRSPKRTAPAAIASRSTNDVLPGGNKAILTLAGGQTIILDSAHNGQLASQGNTNIIKLDSGRLAYRVSIPTNGQPQTRNHQPQTETWNTLTTPRGGQYQLTLPDGTKVWLNAASSITYPTAFTGSNRLVTISGEAYFEVTKDASHPFVVRLPALIKGNNENGAMMDVEVLGTSFNINAYADEALARTTLLEGSVRVRAHGLRKIIHPGEQTTVSVTGPGIGVNPHADTEQVVAWKNGLFAFSKADLPTVMRQLARWYNVDVFYEGNIPPRQFNGEIGKMLTLDQVLKVLTKTRVHYTIDGNKLTIRP